MGLQQSTGRPDRPRRIHALTPRTRSRPHPKNKEVMAGIDSLASALGGSLSGKRILVRSDLNVPLDGTSITDDGRIRASIPTIRALVEAGARVVVAAHLGRPKGTPDPAYSLAPVAARLGELLRSEEHTSELQSLMRISYAVFCLKKKK